MPTYLFIINNLRPHFKPFYKSLKKIVSFMLLVFVLISLCLLSVPPSDLQVSSPLSSTSGVQSTPPSSQAHYMAKGSKIWSILLFLGVEPISGRVLRRILAIWGGLLGLNLLSFMCVALCKPKRIEIQD